MAIAFLWDVEKAATNEQKHGVTFEEATTVLTDPRSLTIYDSDHSTIGEDRYIDLGLSIKGRLLVVVYIEYEVIEFDETQLKIRIISSRLANKDEQKQYNSRK